MNKEQLQALIAEWQAIGPWIAKAKAREKELRTLIAAAVFDGIKQPNGCYPEGTNKAVSITGALCTLGSKVNREILVEVMTTTLAEAQLTVEESAGLIRGKPELGLTAYRKLPEAKRLIIDKMIVVSPGAITLDVSQLPK